VVTAPDPTDDRQICPACAAAGAYGPPAPAASPELKALTRANTGLGLRVAALEAQLRAARAFLEAGSPGAALRVLAADDRP